MLDDRPPDCVPAMPTPIPPTARFRPKPNVLVRELDGEAVLLDRRDRAATSG